MDHSMIRPTDSHCQRMDRREPRASSSGRHPKSSRPSRRPHGHLLVAFVVGVACFGSFVPRVHAAETKCAFAHVPQQRCRRRRLGRCTPSADVGAAVTLRERTRFRTGSHLLFASATSENEVKEGTEILPEDEDEDEDEDVEDSFLTEAQRLYIEDTDAYGVVYNSNYLRIYDRALHWAGISGNVESGGVLTHDNWYITEVEGQKFRVSPPLGGEYVVEGKLLDRAADGGGREVWEVRMMGPRGGDGDGGGEEEEDCSAVLYNAATVTVSKPDHLVPPSLLPPKPDPLPRSEPSVEYVYVPFRDEYDLHLGPTHLPLQSCLNLFERSRSDFLGGPDALRAMKEDEGIIWVVTGVEGCALVNIGHAPDEEDDEASGDEVVRCFPGGEVTVRTDYVARRRGAVLECRHTLLVKGETRRRRLAQAVITMMALDDETRRPARKIPEWFRKKIGEA